MLFRNVYGIDLGSSTIKVYSQAKNKCYIENNMVAVKDRHKVIAVGREAYEMFEKAPDSIQVESPMAFGMIADQAAMEISLYSMLRNIDWKIRFGSVFYFSVPADITQIEKNAYYTISNGGYLQNNRVFLVEKPIADAIALGISIASTRGSMIVNIGAQSTEMSVIADDRIILSRNIPAGGRQIDESICAAVRRKYNLHIGTRTASRLKTAMGNLSEDKEEARKVVGIDSLSGLPREEVIYASAVNEGIRSCVQSVAEEIQHFLERTPPQIACSIGQEGIWLAGGSTRLPGIDRQLSGICQYTFRQSGLYDSCTVTGLEKIIRESGLEKWARPLKQRKL